MPVGQSQRFSFTPGQARPGPTPPPEGDYKLALKDMGPEGLKGWKVKPGKFPCRRITFELLDTQDEETGENKTVTEPVSASPNASFRIYDLALAADYQEEFECALPSRPGDAATREYCEVIDAIITHIKENGVVLNAHIGLEEYQGQQRARIQRWLPSGDLPESTEAAAEESEEVEEAPKPTHKNGKTMQKNGHKR